MADFEKGLKTQSVVDVDHQWGHEDDPVTTLFEQIQNASIKGDDVVDSAEGKKLSAKVDPEQRKLLLREIMQMKAKLEGGLEMNDKMARLSDQKLDELLIANNGVPNSDLDDYFEQGWRYLSPERLVDALYDDRIDESLRAEAIAELTGDLTKPIERPEHKAIDPKKVLEELGGIMDSHFDELNIETQENLDAMVLKDWEGYPDHGLISVLNSDAVGLEVRQEIVRQLIEKAKNTHDQYERRRIDRMLAYVPENLK